MEVNLKNLANNLFAGKVLESVTLNTPVKAIVVEVKDNGVVVVEINGEKMMLNIKDIPVETGTELSLLFTRDSENNLKVKIQQFGNVPFVISGEKDVLSLSKLTSLYNELFRLSIKAGEGQQPIFHEFKAVLEQLLLKGADNYEMDQTLKAFFVSRSDAVEEPVEPISKQLPLIPTPEPGSGPVPVEKEATLPYAIDASARISDPIPKMLEQKIPVRTLEKPEHPLTAPQSGTVALFQRLIELADQVITSDTPSKDLKQKVMDIIIQIKAALISPAVLDRQSIIFKKPDDPVIKLVFPKDVTVQLKVENVRQSGMAVLSYGKGNDIEVALPFTVRKGDFVPAIFSQDKGLVFAKPGIPPEIDPQIIDFVKKALRDLEIEFSSTDFNRMPSKQPVSQPPLILIAEKVQEMTTKYRLTPEEQLSFIKSLLLLHSKGIKEDLIKPDLALYNNIRTIGTGIEEMVRQASLAEKSVNKKEWAAELLRILQPLLEKPLLENEPARRVDVLRKTFENSGQFFENKLFRMLEESGIPASKAQDVDKTLLKAEIKWDLKALIQQLTVFIENSEAPAPIKERLQQETARLNHIIEAVQVKSLAENDYHHMFIPLVNAGEQKSAMISMRRKGKKKKIDGKNTSLTIKVSPSVLGDVEARVEIKNNSLWIHFLLEKDPFRTLLEENQAELWDSLRKTGYAKGGLKTTLFKGGVNSSTVNNTGNKMKTISQVFDVKA